MVEFAGFLTGLIKRSSPIPVYHNFAVSLFNWYLTQIRLECAIDGFVIDAIYFKHLAVVIIMPLLFFQLCCQRP